METKKITMLSKVNAMSNNYTLRLKIVSLWRKMMHGQPNVTYRVDMICMDEQGDMILANCLHKILPRFDHHFKLDEVLLISRASIAPNNATINYTNDKRKLTFTLFSQIEKSVDWCGPKYSFSFVNFKDVVENKVDVGTTVDFIGYVEVCFNMEDTDKKDGSKGKRLNIRVKDIEGHQVIATLWDSFAIEMHDYFNNPNREKHVVVLIHFGVVNLYRDKKGLSTSFDISRMFINSDLDEITSFKKCFVDKFASTPSESDNAGSYMISSAEDEFLNNTGFVLSAYLSTIQKPKKVILVGTVIGICTDKIWYYNACNHCKSSVEETYVTVENEDGSGCFDEKRIVMCTNAKCKGVDIVSFPRYKIPIRVQDSYGTVTLTLFDFEAVKLFKKTAKELVEVHNEELASGGVPKPYPELFDILVGKKLGFIINVLEFNIIHQVENYGISMLTSDANILAGLYSKFKIHEYEKSESTEAQPSGIQSVACDVSKDEVSFTGDNQTPMSKGLENDAKTTSSGEVKRNLHDVYDVDDTLGSSSTKRRVNDGKDECPYSEGGNMLIPKIEK
ncbi:putative nucleic acid-binding, replication factor A [Helianthus annuus]|nr:putative nucleic acid-binding, replication factor A [Helianthus annuus]